MGEPITHAEAMQRALDWAEGRRSFTNEFMAAEADVENRPQTLALIANADAAQVVAWSALAVALADASPSSQPATSTEEGDHAR